MHVTAVCPACQSTLQALVSPSVRALDCSHCRQKVEVPPDAWEGETLKRCLLCPCEELFARKDFPQRLGLAIVAIGFTLSYIAWVYYYITVAWGVLFATAAIDVALYLLMPEAVVCYRCHAHYRDMDAPKKKYEGFDLVVHERHRQEEARLAEQKMKSASSATQQSAAATAPPTLASADVGVTGNLK